MVFDPNVEEMPRQGDTGNIVADWAGNRAIEEHRQKDWLVKGRKLLGRAGTYWAGPEALSSQVGILGQRAHRMKDTRNGSTQLYYSRQ